MRSLAFLVVSAVIVLGGSARAAGTCDRPWVFFDLGNTVLDTKTHDYNPMFYQRDVQKFQDGAIYRDAKEYIDDLRRTGFVLGIMSDIPGDWGVNYPPEAPIRDLRSAKVLRLMRFIEGAHPEDQVSWVGEPMDWSPFGEFVGTGPDRIFKGKVYVPMTDRERKGNGSDALFRRAQAEAKGEGCVVVFLGEDPEEMEMAEKAGLYPFQVGKTYSEFFYLPPDRIASYARNYEAGSWRGQVADQGGTFSRISLAPAR